MLFVQEFRAKIVERGTRAIGELHECVLSGCSLQIPNITLFSTMSAHGSAARSDFDELVPSGTGVTAKVPMSSSILENRRGHAAITCRSETSETRHRWCDSCRPNRLSNISFSSSLDTVRHAASTYNPAGVSTAQSCATADGATTAILVVCVIAAATADVSSGSSDPRY